MRLKLTIAYDGRPFRGWQSQVGGNTVQDHLEKALAAIDGAPVSVHGAGRTDAGVHALGQMAHATVTRETMPPQAWLRALNAHLPPEIRVIKVTRAAKDFHARFDARGKIYRYRIWLGEYQHPLEVGRTWHLPGALDRARLAAAAALLTGQHDFRGFAANRGQPETDTVRTISRILITQRGALIEITFTGDGFLYKMVRLLTGSMIRVAQEKAEFAWLERLLGGEGKSSFAAPADGLSLVRVLY